MASTILWRLLVSMLERHIEVIGHSTPFHIRNHNFEQFKNPGNGKTHHCE